MSIAAEELYRAIKAVKPHIKNEPDGRTPFGLHIEKCGRDIYVSTHRVGSLIVSRCTDLSGSSAPDFHRQIHPESVDTVLSWLPTVIDVSITTDGDFLDFSSGEMIRLDASETSWSHHYDWRDCFKAAMRNMDASSIGQRTLALNADDLVRWSQSSDNLIFIPGSGDYSLLVRGENFIGIQALQEGSGVPVSQADKMLDGAAES